MEYSFISYTATWLSKTQITDSKDPQLSYLLCFNLVRICIIHNPFFGHQHTGTIQR